MRHPSDRPREACSSVSRRQKTSGRLRFESLEVRTMLSAEALTSDLVEFSNAAAGSAGGGITPAEIRAAYGFNNVSFGSTAANGAGQTIAIVDAYNDPNIASDLATFDAEFGIAAPASLKVVNQSGGTNLPSTSSTGGWEVETALDVEWAHAIAPGANILLVEASSDSDANLFAAVNYAREQAGVSVISMSWGSDDTARDASGDQSLAAQYLVTPSGHEGITFVAASGDTGVPTFPSTSPNVLAVGGTDLNLTSSGSIISETAWEPETEGGTTYSGGGGVSQEFSGRKVPDVSYDAGVGYDVYDSFTGGGGWISVGGTSAGSPQWAGLVAIADQGRALAGQSTLNGATQTIAALYAAESDFNDITTGSTQFESAGVGYDLATGLGTPKANLLIPYLASYGTSGGTTTTTTTTPTAPTTVSGSATSSTSVTVSWTTSTGATGYDLYELESGKEVLISTYAAGTTSAGVSGLSASTTYTFQVAAYNTAGTSAAKSVQVTTPAAATTTTSTLAAPVLTGTATGTTTGKLLWTASSGATGYEIYYMRGSQPVALGSVSANTTSVTISGMAPGTTYEFLVLAYNRTSQAASSWTALTTTGTAANTRAFAVDADADSTLMMTGDSSATIVDDSAGLLPVGVTFNQAAANGAVTGNSVSNALATSIFGSTAAVDSLVRGSLPNTGTSMERLGGSSFDPSRDDAIMVSVGNTVASAVMKTDLDRQDYGLSQSWDSFAATSVAGNASTVDHETNFFRRTLVDSLDTLFGRDVERAEMQRAGAQRNGAQSHAESTAAVADANELERPSAALLAVGLALSALWSERDEDDLGSPTTEPRQPMLKRRPVGV